ncbi:MAG: hypothetical protein JSW45_01155, partial [Thiotrichales bacterium]
MNAFQLHQTGLSDAYSAAELGCSHPNTATRIAMVNFTSFEPAAATVVCESYDETTAQWWYWRAAYIAEEPGDSAYFMDGGQYDNEGLAESCPSSPN